MAQCGTGSTQEGGKPSQYEFKIIDWDVLHARIQEFARGGSRPDCQKIALTTSFFLVLWFIGLARFIKISVNRSIYKRKTIIDMKIKKSVTFNGSSVYLFN